MKTYIGIDNGVSGAVGVLYSNGGARWWPMPVRSELNYTKAKKNITRVNYDALYAILGDIVDDSIVVIERPMVNPGRFQATISAVRCLEATLLALENLKFPYQYLDSREWQKTQLPSGLEGAEQLKKASLDVGRRLWPNLTFPKKADCDALLMARHAMLKNL